MDAGSLRPGRLGHTLHEIRADSVISYGTDEAHHGTVVVTHLDPLTHVVEGTFEFEGANGTRSLRVSRGSFRLGYTVAPRGRGSAPD